MRSRSRAAARRPGKLEWCPCEPTPATESLVCDLYCTWRRKALAQGTTSVGPGTRRRPPFRGPLDQFSRGGGILRRSAIVETAETERSPNSWGCLPHVAVFENQVGVGNGQLVAAARAATHEPQTHQGLHSQPAHRHAYTNDQAPP